MPSKSPDAALRDILHHIHLSEPLIHDFDEVLPLAERIEAVVEESDLDEVFDTERHLLYVACTRARDRLLVTGVKPGSEFLMDLMVRGKE
jgi:ATP-dependent exoDNAse (exonuclease V) beta subunit